MRWSLGDFWDDEFVKRTGRTVKSLTDGSLSGATSLASPLQLPVAGLTVPREAAGGGGDAVTPLWADLEWTKSGLAVNTYEVIGNSSPAWTVNTDEIGLTISGYQIQFPSDGLVVATAYTRWSASTAGERRTELWGPTRNNKNTHGAAGSSSDILQPVAHTERVSAGDPFLMTVQHVGTGASLDVQAVLELSFWPR